MPGVTDHAADLDRVHAALRERGATLATAESLTGGGLAEAVSSVPGASASYVGGVVSYATEVKVSLLGVDPEVVAAHGVVSAPCARQMADGVRRLLGADWAVSTTGVAGPTEQDGRPVGTVFVGVAGPDGTTVHELHLPGDRVAVRSGTVAAATGLVLERISGRS